jgi:hypothetical protein
MGTGASKVIKADEVKTQPVPANASNKLKRTKHLSSTGPFFCSVRHGVQVLNKSRKLTASFLSMARLMAYKLVAKTGATTRKPDTALASSQNRSCASQVIKAPPMAMSRPWAKLSQGEWQMSFSPKKSQ